MSSVLHMKHRETIDECAIQRIGRHSFSQMKRPDAFLLKSGADCHVRRVE